jgi:hypothetical protein
MQARRILEQLLAEGQVVTFNSKVGYDPVEVEATVSYNEGAPGSLGNEPGWYVELDKVTMIQGGREVNVNALDPQTIREFERLALETLRG